jgi:flagellar protein FliO/FliZ
MNGMEWMLLVKAVLALGFVTGLIGLCALAARKFRLQERLQGLAGQGGKGRLQIKETLMLDARRRLVLISRDGVEHLLLLSAGGDVVVEASMIRESDDPRVR